MRGYPCAGSRAPEASHLSIRVIAGMVLIVGAVAGGLAGRPCSTGRRPTLRPADARRSRGRPARLRRPCRRPSASTLPDGDRVPVRCARGASGRCARSPPGVRAHASSSPSRDRVGSAGSSAATQRAPLQCRDPAGDGSAAPGCRSRPGRREGRLQRPGRVGRGRRQAGARLAHPSAVVPTGLVAGRRPRRRLDRGRPARRGSGSSCRRRCA